MKQFGHKHEIILKKSINAMKIKSKAKDAIASSATVSSFSAKISSLFVVLSKERVMGHNLWHKLRGIYRCII